MLPMTVAQATIACNNLLKVARKIHTTHSRFNLDYVVIRAEGILKTITTTTPAPSDAVISESNDRAIRNMWQNTLKWDAEGYAPPGGLFDGFDEVKRHREHPKSEHPKALTHTVAIPSLTTTDIEGLSEECLTDAQKEMDTVCAEVSAMIGEPKRVITTLIEILELTGSTRFKNLISAAYRIGRRDGLKELQGVLQQDLKRAG